MLASIHEYTSQSKKHSTHVYMHLTSVHHYNTIANANSIYLHGNIIIRRIIIRMLIFRDR